MINARFSQGNYLGAVKQWVKMQNEAVATDTQLLFCLVDLHAITLLSKTRDNAAPRGVMMPSLAAETRNMAATLLACGIDPARSVVYVQSHVAEHTQLYWLLSCMSSHNRLAAAPQFKVCYGFIFLFALRLTGFFCRRTRAKALKHHFHCSPIRF